MSSDSSTESTYSPSPFPDSLFSSQQTSAGPSAGLIAPSAEALAGDTVESSTDGLVVPPSAPAQRADFGRSRPQGRVNERPARAGIVALMDAEFWRWWHAIPAATSEREVAISARQAVRDALAQTRDGLQLQRIVWVGEQRMQGLDDLRVLAVRDNEADDGWPLARALSQALFDLATGGIVNTVLLVSDDDRLLPAVDEVQRRGMRVLMLQGQDDKLSEEWRRLLAVADRCLVLRSGPVGRSDRLPRASPADGPEHTDRPERSGTRPDPRQYASEAQDANLEPPSAQTLQTLHEAASLWWASLDEAARDALRRALPQSRGLPRDLDRQLLISAARGLDRQLSVPEKHALRGAARELAGRDDDPAGRDTSVKDFDYPV